MSKGLNVAVLAVLAAMAVTFHQMWQPTRKGQGTLGPQMPILSSSFAITLAAAMIPMAAIPAVLTPNELTAYTFAGALAAAFLSVLHMRMGKNLLKWASPQIGFTFLATVFVGWVVPEPFAWWASRQKWITGVEIETLPRQAWAGAGLVFGLGGTTLILGAMNWWKRKFPTDAPEMETAAAVFPSGTEVQLTRAKPVDPPTKTP